MKKWKINELVDTLSFDVQSPVAIGNVRQLLKNWSIDYDVYLPSFERNLQRGCVWSQEQKEKFIKQILAEVPINPISIIMDYNTKSMQVIDGKQRMTTIFSFINNDFPLHVNGCQVYHRDFDDQNRLMLYQFRAYVVYTECDQEFLTDEQKIEWFLFVNNSGTPQQNEHIDTLNNLIK